MRSDNTFGERPFRPSERSRFVQSRGRRRGVDKRGAESRRVVHVNEYLVTFADEAVYRAGRQLSKRPIVPDVHRRHDYRRFVADRGRACLVTLPPAVRSLENMADPPRYCAIVRSADDNRKHGPKEASGASRKVQLPATLRRNYNCTVSE